MRLKHRLEKLEAFSGGRPDTLVVFGSIKSVSGPSELAWARLVGTSVGRITRAEGEDVGAFVRRVFETKVTALGLRRVPLEKLTDNELYARLAALDSDLALELMETGTLTQESIDEHIKRLAAQCPDGAEFQAEHFGTKTT